MGVQEWDAGQVPALVLPLLIYLAGLTLHVTQDPPASAQLPSK